MQHVSMKNSNLFLVLWDAILLQACTIDTILLFSNYMVLFLAFYKLKNKDFQNLNKMEAKKNSLQLEVETFYRYLPYERIEDIKLEVKRLKRVDRKADENSRDFQLKLLSSLKKKCQKNYSKYYKRLKMPYTTGDIISIFKTHNGNYL